MAYHAKRALFAYPVNWTVLTAGAVAFLLFIGHVSLAGLVLWASLGMGLGLATVTLKPERFTALLLSLMPFVNLIRETAFYNISLALLFITLALFVLARPDQTCSLLLRCPLLIGLFSATFIYYIVSFVCTGSYSVNLRFVEFSMTAVVVFLLRPYQSLLHRGLFGLMLSALGVGIAMLPHMQESESDRLGLAQIGETTIGNPIQLGMPLAIAFLALVVDRGVWLGLESRKQARTVLGLLIVAELGLTTSRASWMVAFAGLLLSFCFSAGARKNFLWISGCCAVGIVLLLVSPYSESFLAGFDRTFGSGRTINQMSSGRMDQWRVTGRALSENLTSFLYGHGPGSGPDVYARLSRVVPDVTYAVGSRAAIHSLFLHVSIELGCFGLALLLIWILLTLTKVWRFTRSTRLLFPLVCLAAYVLLALTVLGADAISGACVGIALQPCLKKPRQRVRLARTSRVPTWSVGRSRPVREY
jgi:O-antigen ligase